MLYGGNTLLAHEVGAGKTFEMVASAMESKRPGTVPEIHVCRAEPSDGTVGVRVSAALPFANILVTTKKDFETHNRKKFCARIATGDYDAVIIGHSQFERIPISQERQERLFSSRLRKSPMALQDTKPAQAASALPSRAWSARKRGWRRG